MDVLFEMLSESVRNIANYVTFDYLMLGSLSLLLLVLIYFLIKTNFTFEVRMLRTVIRLNKYFIAEPYVTDENLVRFNKKMKNVPRSLRYHWQEFMLNRDKAPSDYMNSTVCVDQPSKASGYSNTANSINTYTVIIALLTLLVGIAHLFSSNITEKQFYFQVLVLPVIILIVGYLFVAFIRARHTTIVDDLYYQFHEFERNINKACTTLPQFIDYELLFTKKEIKEGIPVLQEYLEKRAVQEKLEQDEAALSSIHYEEYDFSRLGIETSLLLDRSLLESEKYFTIRDDLRDKIKGLEQEKQSFKKAFDEITKEFERKAQISRESLAQYNEQLNNTAIKIEANYIKKRRDEEIKKFQQLEKDYEIAKERFLKEQGEFQEEIDSLENEVQRRKTLLEEAMLAEGKTYANKLFALISKDVKEENQPYLDELENTKEELEKTVSTLKTEIESKGLEIEQKNKQLSETERQYQTKLAGLEGIQALKDYVKSSEFKNSLIDAKNKKLKGGNDLAVKLSEYELKTAELERELESKKTELDDLKNSKLSLEAELTDLNKRHLVLQSEVNRITKLTEDDDSNVKEKKSESLKTDGDQKPKPKKPLKRVAPKTTTKTSGVYNELDELENLKNKIDKESNNLQKQQRELKNTIEKTITTLENDVEVISRGETPKEEVKVTPLKRKNNLSDSLNQLVDAASKISKKPNSNKSDDEK